MGKNNTVIRRMRRNAPFGDKGYLPYPFESLFSLQENIATGGVVLEIPLTPSNKAWIKRMSLRLWSPAPSLVAEVFKADPTGKTGKDRADIFVTELASTLSFTNYTGLKAEEFFFKNDDKKNSIYLLITHTEVSPISFSLNTEFLVIG